MSITRLRSIAALVHPAAASRTILAPITWRSHARQRERWPALAGVHARFRGRKDGYGDSVLLSGLPVGTPEDFPDCGCGLYLADPSAWREYLPPASS